MARERGHAAMRIRLIARPCPHRLAPCGPPPYERRATFAAAPPFRPWPPKPRDRQAQLR